MGIDPKVHAAFQHQLNLQFPRRPDGLPGTKARRSIKTLGTGLMLRLELTQHFLHNTTGLAKIKAAGIFFLQGIHTLAHIAKAFTVDLFDDL